MRKLSREVSARILGMLLSGVMKPEDLKVLKHWLDGGEIQSKMNSNDIWITAKNPGWLYSSRTYRKKPMSCYINIYADIDTGERITDKGLCNGMPDVCAHPSKDKALKNCSGGGRTFRIEEVLI